MTKPKKPKDKLEQPRSVNFEPPKEWEKYEKELGQFKASIEARLATPEMREAEENTRRLAESAKQHAEELEAINLKFENLLSVIKTNPNTDGWIRLCEILIEAKKDKRIISSAGASDFLEFMWLIAGDSFTAATADEALQSLISDLKSSDSSAMALKRWKEEKRVREWVIGEWGQHKSGHRSKADFSRIYARRVLNEFGIEVTERTIRERWLKGI